MGENEGGLLCYVKLPETAINEPQKGPRFTLLIIAYNWPLLGK